MKISQTVLLRVLCVVAGLAIAAGGGWVAAVGFAHNDGSRLAHARYEVPYPDAAIAMVRVTVSFLRTLPSDYRASLQISERGMVYPLGGGGGLVAAMGIILFLNGAFRRAARHEEVVRVVKLDDRRVDDSLLGNPAARKGATASISIDEALMDEEEDEDEKLRDVNYLVTLAQSNLEKDTIARVVRIFRPDLEKYLPMFNDSGAERFAHQVLESVILRHRRRGKEITADQYHSQDGRITECERYPFCHRYMPQKRQTAVERREFVGKVFDAHTRSEVQKQVAGEADDWADVSLRNAKDVLSAKTVLEMPV